MKQLLIKDNQYRAKSDFDEVKDVVNSVADKTLVELEKEGVFVFTSSVRYAEDLTNDQIILQSYNDMYISGNVMGFLGVDNQRIVIESRFSRGERDYFFQYLLEKVLKFPNFINLETSANQDDRVFSLLLFLFPRYLRDAMRKGLFKTYIRRQYNDRNVRGSIDVARHIKKNTPFVGNIAYSQREYSYDNYLMELVRHTIEYIKGKNCGRMLLGTIKEEVEQVIQATNGYRAGDRRKVIDSNIKNVVRHAYYHEYRSLQQLCILILRNEQHRYGNGTRNVYGILFDGAWLWEEYLNTILHGLGFHHPENKRQIGGFKMFRHQNEDEQISRNSRVLFPDFYKDDFILDAKYKHLNRGIGREDLYQVVTYMYCRKANHGGYVYPDEGANSYSRYQLEGYNGYIHLLPVSIPQEMSHYNAFIQAMDESENRLRSLIQDVK